MDSPDVEQVEKVDLNGLFGPASSETANGTASEERVLNPQTSGLIESVRENRCLYDKTDASYHNNMLKVKIWQTIASEQGYPDAKTVAAKWKNLRGKYNKCRKRLAALAQDPEKFHLFDQNKWTYYDDMAWLEPHMEVDVEQQQTDEPAERTSVMESLMEFVMKEEKLSDDDSSSNNQQDGWNSVQQQDEVQVCNGGDSHRMVISSANPNKRLRLQQRKSQNFNQFNQLLKGLAAQSPQQTDYSASMGIMNSLQQFTEEELYGLSVGRRLSKLPQQKRALARLKFEQAFYELETAEKD